MVGRFKDVLRLDVERLGDPENSVEDGIRPSRNVRRIPSI